MAKLLPINFIIIAKLQQSNNWNMNYMILLNENFKPDRREFWFLVKETWKNCKLKIRWEKEVL